MYTYVYKKEVLKMKSIYFLMNKENILESIRNNNTSKKKTAGLKSLKKEAINNLNIILKREELQYLIIVMLIYL